MSLRWSDVRAEDVEHVRALAERRLSRDEWEAYVGQPPTDEEREETSALLDWFLRRYPTPADRLRYARRAYRRWTAQLRAVAERSGAGP